jgi:DNA-binding NtrC family response regulator
MNKPFRILIVEDGQNMMRTLADILTTSGYVAETAGLAEEGLRKMEATPFDCVVSDIVLPGMNGVEFQKVIKEKYGAIPVVLITAYTDNEQIARAREQGALAFMEKPLDIPLLLSFLKVIAQEDFKKNKDSGNFNIYAR